ncbi:MULTISPECIES: tripartite tricarboxylate transporter substrate-binding protein [unclassified Bradyrhizobium]|uniref:tripartite tricarboxylate transporter substrate-binding protein n=1 Tax=unclassified Bradyrhizobium TaxID=2631580 RepID=UPI0029169838|nr:MULTISPECIES: tripartite tricarboxylate transporter substrate-binding protein [unclassified Bradyrhizobium]
MKWPLAASVALVAMFAFADQALACRVATNQSIFFEEGHLPVIEGTVAVDIEVIETTSVSGPIAVRVSRVVRGQLASGPLSLVVEVSSCGGYPPAGSKGVVVGRVSRQSDGSNVIAALWNYPNRSRLTSETPSCPMPAPQADSDVLALGGSRSRGISPISTVGLDRTTIVSNVRIEGDRPLYLVLGSRAPTIWSLDGNVGLIDRVVVASDKSLGAMYTSAVSGIPPEKVSFTTCLPMATGGLEDDALRTMLLQEIGRANRIVHSDDLTGIRMPSFERFVPDDVEKPVRLDETSIVSVGLLDRYDILPGKAGLDALAGDRAIEEDVDASRRPALRGNKVYRILKPIHRLPALSQYTIYILPAGMDPPVNASDYCVFDGRTGYLIDASLGHWGCSVRNILTETGKDPTASVLSKAPPCRPSFICSASIPMPELRPTEIPLRPEAYVRIEYLKPDRDMRSMRGFLQYELEFAFHRITGAPTDRKWPPPPDNSLDYHFVMFGSDALPPDNVVPLRGFARVPYVLLAAPRLPPRTVADLVRYARSNKTLIRYVDSGGTATRVMENFLNHFDIRGERIPASGDDAYAAVITGRADLMMSTILHAAAVTNTGLVRTLAVTGAGRNARLPNVPAVAEFFPDYSDGDWYAVGAKKNVGADEFLALADMMKTVDHDPATSVKFRELGVDLFDVGPENIVKLLKR